MNFNPVKLFKYINEKKKTAAIYPAAFLLFSLQFLQLLIKLCLPFQFRINFTLTQDNFFSTEILVLARLDNLQVNKMYNK